MKISLISPVYNESKYIETYFRTLEKIDYPRKDFEVVLVNDGSSDNSFEVLKKFKKNSLIDVKIINLEKNSGRSVAIEKGVSHAKYDNVLIMGFKCEIFPDAFREIKKLNFKPLIGNAIQRSRNIMDNFLSIIRRNIYPDSFGTKFKDIVVTKENFDSIGKGTIYFCDKKLFLSSQVSNKEDKNNSDDTKLLWNMVQKKEILKTSKLNCYYNTRTSFLQNIKHIYNRGPKFIDYYYKPSKKHFWLINLVLVGIIATATSAISQNFVIETILALLIADSLLSLYLSHNLKESITVFLLFPVFSTIFLLGIIKGIILKTIITTPKTRKI